MNYILCVHDVSDMHFLLQYIQNICTTASNNLSKTFSSIVYDIEFSISIFFHHPVGMFSEAKVFVCCNPLTPVA